MQLSTIIWRYTYQTGVAHQASLSTYHKCIHPARLCPKTIHCVNPWIPKLVFLRTGLDWMCHNLEMRSVQNLTKQTVYFSTYLNKSFESRLNTIHTCKTFILKKGGSTRLSPQWHTMTREGLEILYLHNQHCVFQMNIKFVWSFNAIVTCALKPSQICRVLHKRNYGFKEVAYVARKQLTRPCLCLFLTQPS